jgi:hypothetical protein
MVVACGSALLLLMRFAGLRSTHSGLVGGMLGPLCVVAIVLPGLPRIEGVWVQLAAAVGAGLLLALAGVAGALLAKRLEGEQPASAALCWTGASLALAGLAWNLYGDRTAAWLAHAAIPSGGVVGALGLLGRTPGGPRTPRTHFGGLLLVLSVAGGAAPFWPRWLPWLLADQNTPEVGIWPPNFLFVALEAPGAFQEGDLRASPGSLELLGSDAVTYTGLFPEPDVGSLISLPDGSSLGGRLHARGYATAAIGVVPERLRQLGIAEIDDRPGGRRLLEEPAAWMAGAPLLLGPASGLLGLLGHDRALRSPEEVGDEAARWILGWRTMRAPAPFFLFVDLRTPDGGAEALDAGLQRILDRLEDLQLDSVTLLVVATETRASVGSSPSLRALVIPPSTWPHATRLEVGAQVWGRALSQSLLEIALSDGESPVQLSGLDQELVPPKRP